MNDVFCTFLTHKFCCSLSLVWCVTWTCHFFMVKAFKLFISAQISPHSTSRCQGGSCLSLFPVASSKLGGLSCFLNQVLNYYKIIQQKSQTMTLFFFVFPQKRKFPAKKDYECYDNSSKKGPIKINFKVSILNKCVLFVIIITLIEQFRFIKYGVNLYLKNDC